MFKKILIAGCLVWLPLIATLWIIKFLVNLLDQAVQLLPISYQPQSWLGINIPGFGVVIVVLVVLLTGVLVANFLGDKLVKMWDRLLKRVPLVGAVYSTIKQVLETLMSADGKSFRKVVLVEWPRTGMWAIAFVTGEAPTEINDQTQEKMLTIFIPTTPNPTSGFIMMIPESSAKVLNMPVEQALKFIVSLGTIHVDPTLELGKPLAQKQIKQ